MNRMAAPVVIDVRTAGEFAQTALEGALHVPLPELSASLPFLVPDRGTPLALYCAGGGRSEMGCQLLRQLGYTRVTNAGGMLQAAAALGRTLR